ncbi:type IVB secretion system protein IcmH/DotU [Pseudomonas sp. HN11]|uniref:type IVB secretion system protein IcmH/DotU n=1 Tax=Pseudomonas sp. HN11 TaxID=1344094 RepID=UPI001F1D8533|nr:type IVB secretion system protein IcmH/DotU [Pseudomonas sp. HN11]UII73288.1 type IVB secretion system protein IcmH/DotU [Pseudomonas sp. HN11]
MSDAISNRATHTEPTPATSPENTLEPTSTGTKPEPLLADPEFDMRGLAWNPLCDAATPLIGLVIRLRRLDRHDDVPALYQSVSNQITTIMEEVNQLDYDAGMLKAYSYSLCLLLDEVVMSTTWGKSSTWSARSLLSQFHEETWGGEKFFTVMNNMIPEAARYQHVLEFIPANTAYRQAKPTSISSPASPPKKACSTPSNTAPTATPWSSPTASAAWAPSARTPIAR